MGTALSQVKMLCSGNSDAITIKRSDREPVTLSIDEIMAKAESAESPLRIPPDIDIELDLEPDLRFQFLSCLRPGEDTISAFEICEDEDGEKNGDQYHNWGDEGNEPLTPIAAGVSIDGTEWGWYRTGQSETYDPVIWQLVPSDFGNLIYNCCVQTMSIGLTGSACVEVATGPVASLLTLSMEDQPTVNLVVYGATPDTLLNQAVLWGLSIDPDWYDGGPAGDWCPTCASGQFERENWYEDEWAYLKIDASSAFSNEAIGSALGILWEPCTKHTTKPFESSGREWNWDGSTWVC